MIVSKIKIVNYKSIEDMSLIFSHGKNIIVGQNNSGKSNIISAINLVLGEKLPPKVFDENFYHKERNDFFVNISLSNCCDFDISYLKIYNKKMDLFEISTVDDLKKSAEELDQEGYNHSWKDSQSIISLIQSAEKIFISLYSEKGEESVYSLALKVEDKYLKFRYFAKELLSSFITSAIIPSERSIKSDLIVNNYSWYGKLIKNTWDNQIHEQAQELKDNNEKLSQITNKIFRTLTDELESSVKDAIFYNSLVFKLIQDTKTDYYKGIKILLDDGYYSLLDDKGSGIKSLIIIELFKLYCKKYHKSSSCLIIEEPEVFLHPQARRVLSKKIDQFLTIGSNQTILTTHSEQFLSDFDIRQLVFIAKDNGKSLAYKISDGDFTVKELQKMNIITKTENAEMYFADAVILVEGGEKYIVKSVIESFYGNLILDYNNVSIIAVGGKDYLSIYKKMLEKLNKKVYIFADYDNLKDKASEFLSIESNNILNALKGKYSGLIKYNDMASDDRIIIDNLLIELENKNIYYLKEGELEDYYLSQKINQMCTEEKISGKEIVAHYISTIINKDNILEYLNIENDFKVNIEKILIKLGVIKEDNN